MNCPVLCFDVIFCVILFFAVEISCHIPKIQFCLESCFVDDIKVIRCIMMRCYVVCYTVL
nr:MAG TPA: hypothetical protein [Caudoviricetes sp.]